MVLTSYISTPQEGIRVEYIMVNGRVNKRKKKKENIFDVNCTMYDEI